MGRPVFSLMITAALVMCLGLFSGCEKSSREPSQGIGELELYTFSPDRQHYLSNAQPFTLPPSTSRRDALDRLGGHLAHTYFQKTYTNKETDIRFEVLHIHTIVTPSRPLHIATVNMVDPDRDAMGYFFQGSAGARTTFYMLGATFLQPQLDPPLIDGLVLFYNGEILPELDHINLAGILTPPMARHVAKRAIDGRKR